MNGNIHHETFTKKRLGKLAGFFTGDMKMNERMTPIKAIRAKCLDCCSGQVKAVRECNISRCSLYLYRMGKRPSSRDNSSP